MKWTVENDDQGRTIWRGQSSVFNMGRISDRQTNKGTTHGAIFGAGLGLFALFLIFAGISGASGVGPLGTFVLVIALFGGGVWLYNAQWQPKNPEWLRSQWSASINGHTLEYAGRDAWRANLDQIASVEAGRTVEWQPVRYYDGKPEPVPDAEWQTFLILADQSRRVVHTANADREGCATLAASIRAHVEAVRASPAPLTVAAPAGDGFNL